MSKIVIGIGNNKNGRSYNNNTQCGQKKGKVIKRASLVIYLPLVKRCFRYGAPLENTIDATTQAAQDNIKMFVCSKLGFGGYKPFSNSYSTYLMGIQFRQEEKLIITKYCLAINLI